MQGRDETIYHAISLEDLVALLDSNTSFGLAHEEAAARLCTYGNNAIAPASTTSAWRLFLNQFRSPIVYLLLFATAISIAFQEWLDAVAIVIVILANALIGFYMEYKARTSMLALRKLATVPAKVLRGGSLHEVNSEDLVPGDMLYVEAGDIVLADGRIVRSAQLQVDESSMTGESVPVEKAHGQLPEETVLADRKNMTYKGTAVATGNAYILVHATGMHTELGKIASLVHAADQAATPLEKKLEAFSRKLIRITIGLVVLIFIVGLLNGHAVLEMLTTAVALAVAAIPEGLPIVATMSLAQGMLKMARYHVIVKKLSAVETLGGTNVICTDKTGTLTQNKMEVVFLHLPCGMWMKDADNNIGDNELQLPLECMVLCNTAALKKTGDCIQEIGDPLEVALLHFAETRGIDVTSLRKAHEKQEEIAFSSVTRIMASVHGYGGRRLAFAKGGAEELLSRCNFIHESADRLMNEDDREAWLDAAAGYASKGHRMIALAYKNMGAEKGQMAEELVFLGLVGMIDPPRPEVTGALKDCRTAGIKVIMITGDHPATAMHIARQLGIAAEGAQPVVGLEMKPYKQLSEADKERWVNTTVFARVNPKQKLDLVTVLQEKGFVVGMTGDGVNDAPALKKSDIGIAMGARGTQAAQEVADMVLKNDSFSSIVVAIRQGRIIFDNIKKFVTFLLSCNLSELIVIAIAAIANLHFQLFPLQILFINLVTDVLPALALGVTRGSAGIMKQPPRAATEPIINSVGWRRIFFYSIVIGVCSLSPVLFDHNIFHHGITIDAAACNNILFFTLILCQLLHVFNMGTGSFFRSEVMRNIYAWLAVASSIAIILVLMQFPYVREALHIVPMRTSEWGITASAGVASVLLIQLGKNLKIFNRP